MFDQIMTVAAEDVQVGDQLYNSQATHPAFRWARVTEVVKTSSPVRLEGGAIVEREAYELLTSGWYTVATRGEAVGVKRFPK